MICWLLRILLFSFHSNTLLCHASYIRPTIHPGNGHLEGHWIGTNYQFPGQDSHPQDNVLGRQKFYVHQQPET